MPFNPDDQFPKLETGPSAEELDVVQELTRSLTGSDDPREALRVFLRGSWDKTIVAVNRIKESPFYEEAGPGAPHGSYEGRHLIGRDVPIHGGVYIGQGVREAIVVDEKYGTLTKTYKEFFRERKKLLRAGERKSFKAGILKDVYNFSLEKLPYRMDIANFVEESYVNEGDEKVALDTYLEMGGGICRHQALFIGYLLEKMVNDGLLGGEVSVDRNYVPMRGGHAWVRYTSNSGQVFIIDTALRYIGKLDDLDEQMWFYARPEDGD